MIYYTGDIHGDPYEVIQFCDSKKLTEQDTLVLLGDVGANYYRNRRDTEMKRSGRPASLPIARSSGTAGQSG